LGACPIEYPVISVIESIESFTGWDNSVGKWDKEKDIVLEVARRMVKKGLVAGTAGNVSLRLPPEGDRGLMAVTPSSRPYAALSAGDIQVVDFDGRTAEGTLSPSMETGLHIAIYRARPDINAVIHTHSVFASAVAVAGLDIPAILDDQVAFLGGEIRTAGYAPTGSPVQREKVLAALGDRNGVLLANHGTVGTGRDMDAAFTACELIEKTAAIFLMARSAGKVNLLPPEAIAAKRAIYEKLRRGQTEVNP
jgi:L-ribulose-5-phosphate 4-epimerase